MARQSRTLPRDPLQKQILFSKPAEAQILIPQIQSVTHLQEVGISELLSVCSSPVSARALLLNGRSLLASLIRPSSPGVVVDRGPAVSKGTTLTIGCTSIRCPRWSPNVSAFTGRDAVCPGSRSTGRLPPTGLPVSFAELRMALQGSGKTAVTMSCIVWPAANHWSSNTGCAGTSVSAVCLCAKRPSSNRWNASPSRSSPWVLSFPAVGDKLDNFFAPYQQNKSSRPGSPTK
jgi:hypothetical protein